MQTAKNSHACVSAALNGLMAEAFMRTQKGWIEKHPDADMDSAIAEFREALSAYGRGEKFVQKALEDAGFISPTPGSNEMALLSFAGQQAAQMQELAEKYDIKQVNFTPEKIEGNIALVSDMQPVKALTGNEFSVGGKDLVDQVTKYFAKLGGSVYNEELGDVDLTKKGAKADIGHGMGRNKAASFQAVGEVISKGRVIDYQKNWKNRQYDTAVIAAPIKIGDQDFYMGVVVKRSNVQTFYLHEVILQEKSEIESRSTTVPGNAEGSRSGSNLTINSVLEKLNSVKVNPGEKTEKVNE
ncbi:MAG: hypothetical protein IJE17_00155 [Clostridia bacterium]|nr:hypothetical protein [Clostridia bacterium]